MAVLFLVAGLFFFALVDVEVSQLISGLISGDDVKPITKSVFLQEFLGQILEVALGKVNVVGADNDGAARTSDGDGRTKVSGFSVHFNAVVKELFKESNIHDTISDGFGAVNLEFVVNGSNGGFLIENI